MSCSGSTALSSAFRGSSRERGNLGGGRRVCSPPPVATPRRAMGRVRRRFGALLGALVLVDEGAARRRAALAHARLLEGARLASLARMRREVEAEDCD